MAPEFRFIARHFRPLAGPGALDLSDDAAILAPPAGREMVIAADAGIEGVHFRPTDPADTIGRKVLRANLSDLAAMGAVPLGYLLTLAIAPGRDDAFFAAFAAGLAQDQARYGLSLLGGDTTVGTDRLVVSITVLGHLAPRTALRRNGARAGDGIWVTGTIGDAALGLHPGRVADPEGELADRYLLPRPRLGLALHGIATAAMDVSDGLVQDCGHLARASSLRATIEAAQVPLSAPARAAGPGVLSTCLTGGDDYELLLAVPPANAPALRAQAARSAVQITRIGTFTACADRDEAGTVVVVDADGQALTLDREGWTHHP